MEAIILIGLTLLNTGGNILWSIPGLLLSIIGLQIFKISKNNMLKIYPHVLIQSIMKEDEPEGWIVGLCFLGYIHNSQNNQNQGETKFIYINV